MKHHRPFLTLWTLAVAASVLAFVVHLAMRGRTMALAYELGQKRAEQARLREVKRVLELEVSSYQTPQRVEMVARTMLHMEPPAPERIINLTAHPANTAPAAQPGVDRPAVAAARLPGGKPAGSGDVRVAPAPTATELLTPRITPPKTALPAASGEPAQ